MSVSVGTFALHVVCSTLAAITVALVSGGGPAAEAVAEAAVFAGMESFQSMVEKLAGLALDDDGADVGWGSQVWQEMCVCLLLIHKHFSAVWCIHSTCM